jgi:hypothetical protein
MNARYWMGTIALLCIFGSAAYGQNSRQPGQVAPGASAFSDADQPVILSPTGELPASALRSTRIASVSNHDRSATLWKVSIATMLAASAFDAASSMGKSEQNPLLRGSDGTFGARGVAIKFALVGASLTPQIIFRNRKDLRRLFTIINFGDTAMFTTIGVHNLGVKPVQ